MSRECRPRRAGRPFANCGNDVAPTLGFGPILIAHVPVPCCIRKFDHKCQEVPVGAFPARFRGTLLATEADCQRYSELFQAALLRVGDVAQLTEELVADTEVASGDPVQFSPHLLETVPGTGSSHGLALQTQDDAIVLARAKLCYSREG